MSVLRSESGPGHLGVQRGINSGHARMGIRIKPAGAGDGQAAEDVTRLSVQGLAEDFYSAGKIAG